MLIVCDIWAKRLEHYEFNINILKIIKKIITNDKVQYFGSKEQIKIFHLEEKISGIIFHEENIVFITTKTRYKALYGYILNLVKIKKLKSKKIIILNAPPIIIFLSKFIFDSNKKIYFFIHGMDKLEEVNKGSYKYLNFFFNFRNKKEKHKYIVLGENIKENLIKIFPNMKEQFFSIDHPYSFEKEYGYKDINKILSLGTVGITSKEKGLENIFEFIEKIAKKYNFKHIGKSISEIPNRFEKYFPYKNIFLEKNKFEEEILNLDYILILYPKDSYKLTASGVYFDCIKYNKPLLGLKNEYFEYMFKKYGEIGKLFESIDEIIEYLSQERKILDSDYDIFHKNMKNIKKVLNKNVEKQLKEIIEV